jgi:hypothetical protein
MPVALSFKDRAFNFNYDKIDHTGDQMKFNETNDSFYFDILKN